ncbi:MAG: LacI family DNA-binding transcriptional regulator [Acidimicrobiales bacterium]
MGEKEAKAKQSRPTIRDVALLAGVSVATVSNVVNGHSHVRPSTKQKVFDAIDSLGYRASRAAKSLPAGRTFLLAYCLPRDPSPNAPLDVFLHEMVETASQADLEFLLFNKREGEPQTGPYARILRAGGADGFVLSGIEYQDERVKFLSERDIPFACFGRVDEPEGVAWVDVDGAAGIRAAVQHVHELGHDRLTFVGWPQGSATGDHRHEGFVEASEALGISCERIVRCTGEFAHGRLVVPEIMSKFDPTAIICVSDTIALGVMAGLREAGLEPGRDIAVTGFDDIPAASLTAPGLTSIRQPMQLVGGLLVKRIVARLTGKDEPESVLVEPELIVRHSTIGADLGTTNMASL